MSTDAERDVEDFFNEEVFGAKPPVENEEPFPVEAPPEPKPADELVVDDEVPVEAPAPEEEQSGEDAPSEPAPTEPTPEEEKEGAPEPKPELEDEALAWAKKQYGDELDVDMLVRAAYEKEKLLGKQAEQARLDREERQRIEIQQRIDALNTPGVLTVEEDSWVDEAIGTNDPGEYAYDALQSGRPDLYAAVMDRWASLGETESRRARVLHSQVLQLVTQPQPSEQESYALALGQTFASLGLDIDTHGPLILAKAEELGNVHPAVRGLQSQDADIRSLATRAIYDLVMAGRSTVAKARTDDVVAARVQEERLRENAAGVTEGGPRVEQPKQSPFWEEFDAELAERGWDGNRPSYGREERANPS